jgi:fucose permease
MAESEFERLITTKTGEQHKVEQPGSWSARGWFCCVVGALLALLSLWLVSTIDRLHRLCFCCSCGVLTCRAVLCCAGLLAAVASAAGDLGPFIKRYGVLTDGGHDTVSSSSCQHL